MLPRDIYMSFDKSCLYHKKMIEIENASIKSLMREIIHGMFFKQISKDYMAVAMVLGEKFYVTFHETDGRVKFHTISTTKWTIRIVENLYPGHLHKLHADDPYTLCLDNGSIAEVEKSFVLLKLNLRSLIEQITLPER